MIPAETQRKCAWSLATSLFCGKRDAKKLLEIIRSFGVDAKQIGRTEKSTKQDRANHLTVMHGRQKLTYSL